MLYSGKIDTCFIVFHFLMSITFPLSDLITVDPITYCNYWNPGSRSDWKVLWETERPSVGFVNPNGEAERLGISSGSAPWPIKRFEGSWAIMLKTVNKFKCDLQSIFTAKLEILTFPVELQMNIENIFSICMLCRKTSSAP